MIVLRRDINRAKSIDFLPMQEEEDSDAEAKENYGAIASDDDPNMRKRNSSIVTDKEGNPA